MAKSPLWTRASSRPIKGWAPPGCQTRPLVGIALVGDPDVGLEVLQLVVLGDLLRIADDLEDHHVPAVGEDKGPLFAERAVVGLVQEERILVDELFLRLVEGQVLKAALLLKADECLRLDADKVALHRGRLDLEAGDVAVVVDGLDEGLVVDAEMGPDEPLLQLGQDCLIEEGDLEEEVLIERLLVDAELVRHEADRRNAAALAVAAVVHLHGRLEDVAAAHRDAAGEAGDAASAFFRLAERPVGLSLR